MCAPAAQPRLIAVIDAYSPRVSEGFCASRPPDKEPRIKRHFSKCVVHVTLVAAATWTCTSSRCKDLDFLQLHRAPTRPRSRTPQHINPACLRLPVVKIYVEPA